MVLCGALDRMVPPFYGSNCKPTPLALPTQFILYKVSHIREINKEFLLFTNKCIG